VTYGLYAENGSSWGEMVSLKKAGLGAGSSQFA